MTRPFNFSPGPAVLPEPVLRRAAAEMLDWHGTGMSVTEMSHRGKEFMSIYHAAQASLRELLAIPDDYKLLFLQGGAIGQNAIVPMNLLRGKTRADYVNTGDWSKRSIAEAEHFCTVNVAASGEGNGFTAIPPQAEWRLDPGAAYVHICSNETIIGLEYHWTPDTGAVPLVADMSSDILSRPIDVSRYGLIYAGAQKNIGPAGLTLVIVRDDLLGGALATTPSAFNYADPGGQRLDDQHAADVRDLPRRAGLRLDPRARRPGGDGRAQPRQGRPPLRLPRRQRLLPDARRRRRSLADERLLPPARPGARRRPSSKARATPACSTSRATASSAAFAPRSTTPCRSRACGPWSPT